MSSEKHVKQSQEINSSTCTALICSNDQDLQKMCHQILKNVLHAIHEDDVNSLKKIFVEADQLNKEENDSESSIDLDITTQLQETNIVILACKLNRPNVLRYLFANEDMFSRIFGGFPPPEHEDKQHHNAFYYAIRNGNVDILKTLTFKWPGCNFSERSKEFNLVLLKAYHEVKLKNIEVCQEVNVFTESILLYNHHYTSCGHSPNVEAIKNTSTVEQIEMIIDEINFIVSTYNDQEIDDVCLLSLRFIASSLYNLGDLKSVHTKLPWEEMTFLLLAFIVAKMCEPRRRLIYCSFLTKRKMLVYLNRFADSLAGNKGNLKSSDGCNVSRFVHNTRHNKQTSMFVELNCEYSSIKNAFALDTMKCYLETVETAGPKWEFISLLLTRCLQVLRANIVEFPKLSSITCEFLLQAVSKSTRDILLCKCNAKLFVSSMSKKSKGFNDLLKDMCKLNHILATILNETKIQALITLLEMVVNETCLNDVLEILEVLDSITIDSTVLPNTDMRILKQVQKFKVQLNISVTDKTLYEEELLSDIQEVLNDEKFNKHSQNDEKAISMLQYLKFYIRGKNMTEADFIHIKHTAHQILLFIEPQKVCGSVKCIIEMILKIWNSVVPRMQEGASKLYNIILQILKITELQTGQTPWINEMWSKLNKTCFVHKYENEGNTNDFQCMHVKVSSKFNTRNFDVMSKLAPSSFGNSDNVLHHLEMSNELFNDFLYYQNNKSVQAVVEALVVDELHTLCKESTLINSLSFQEGFVLQEVGLYSFLSEGFILSNTYLSDSSITPFINAMLLCHGALPSEKQKHQEQMVNRSVKTYSNHKIDKNTVANQNNMFTALTKGELEVVERCVKEGADINGRSCKLWSSLHFAAKGGCVEAVKYLLDQNMGVYVKDMNGQNPLHIAAKYGRKNVVDYLINETNISISETDNLGKTPFLYAIQNGFEDIVSILLKKRTDSITFSSAPKPSVCKIFCEKSAELFCDQGTECNDNAVDIFISLYSAAGSGCTKLIEDILANKCIIKIRHDILGTPLHIAAENGFVQTVKYLISKGSFVDDENRDGCTPIHLAVRSGHEQVVRLLLENGSNVNITEKTLNYTPLRYAVHGGYTQIIKLLLEKGAKMNDFCLEGMSSLHSAVIKENINSVHILIKNGASVNAASKDGSTSLHLSAMKDNKEIVAFLIRNGGNVNAQNRKKQTVLHVASENGCEQVCRILLTGDANVNAKDIHGFTPLHLSCRRGHISVIHLLLEKGADVNGRDKHERTALHIIALFDIFNAIEILAEKRININCRDKDGFTALHLASLKGNVRSVEKLISKNANVNATDFNDVSSLHLAVLGNHTDAVKILIENGTFIDGIVSSDNSCLNKGTINWVEMFQKELLELMMKDAPDLQSIFLKRYGNKWAEDARVLTPLYLAEYNNNPVITSLLLFKGAKIWVRGSLCLMTSTYFGYQQIVKIILEKSRGQIAPKNDTPNFLFVAAFKGHFEIVKLLLSMGFSKPSSSLLCSPLYAAAERGHYEIVKLLLDKNANANLIDCFGTTPLHRAAALGHKKIVELFLESKVVAAHSRDLVDTSPLEQAASGGFIEIAEMLLKERRVNINEKGKDDYTVLHIAAQEGRLEMVKFLVSKNANVTACNSKGSKPIHVAAREGHVKIVEFFLNVGLDINIRGHCEQTCLHYAVQAGQTQTVNFLLQQKINVNVADEYGMTALHFSAVMCHKNLVNVLLQHGAYYNVVDKINKATPLQMARNEDTSNIFLAIEKFFGAVKIDSLSLVEECIEDGVVINAQNKDNVTALLFAAWKGFTSIVDILLRNSADPNIPGKGGCSSLHYASKFSHLKVVKTLLANGAVYNFKNSAQKTPLDLSVNPDITHLLTLVDKLFTYAENGDQKLISELKIVQEVDTMKAILNACNEENEKLIDCANNNKYPFYDELQKICNTSVPMNLAKELFGRKRYEEGLNVLFKR